MKVKEKPPFDSYEELFILADQHDCWVELTVDDNVKEKDNRLLYLIIRKKDKSGIVGSIPIPNILEIEEEAGKLLKKISKKL